MTIQIQAICFICYCGFIHYC